MAVYLLPPRAFHRRIATLPEVKAAVRAAAVEIGQRAEADLSAHRASGNSSIEVTHGRIDSLVSLVDPGGNALAIEEGHKPSGAYAAANIPPINPLHILARAAGLL